MSSAPIAESPLLVQIMVELRHRYANLNSHYEAEFTDSFCTRGCGHAHQTLMDAEECATWNGTGWYVVAVDWDSPLETTIDVPLRAINDAETSEPATDDDDLLPTRLD
jgi:hypothetical protein